MFQELPEEVTRPFDNTASGCQTYNDKKDGYVYHPDVQETEDEILENGLRYTPVCRGNKEGDLNGSREEIHEENHTSWKKEYIRFYTEANEMLKDISSITDFLSNRMKAYGKDIDAWGESHKVQKETLGKFILQLETNINSVLSDLNVCMPVVEGEGESINKLLQSLQDDQIHEMQAEMIRNGCGNLQLIRTQAAASIYPLASRIQEMFGVALAWASDNQGKNTGIIAGTRRIVGSALSAIWGLTTKTLSKLSEYKGAFFSVLLTFGLYWFTKVSNGNPLWSGLGASLMEFSKVWCTVAANPITAYIVIRMLWWGVDGLNQSRSAGKKVATLDRSMTMIIDHADEIDSINDAARRMMPQVDPEIEMVINEKFASSSKAPSDNDDGGDGLGITAIKSLIAIVVLGAMTYAATTCDSGKAMMDAIKTKSGYVPEAGIFKNSGDMLSKLTEYAKTQVGFLFTWDTWTNGYDSISAMMSQIIGSIGDFVQRTFNSAYSYVFPAGAAARATAADEAVKAAAASVEAATKVAADTAKLLEAQTKKTAAFLNTQASSKAFKNNKELLGTAKDTYNSFMTSEGASSMAMDASNATFGLNKATEAYETAKTALNNARATKSAAKDAAKIANEMFNKAKDAADSAKGAAEAAATASEKLSSINKFSTYLDGLINGSNTVKNVFMGIVSGFFLSMIWTVMKVVSWFTKDMRPSSESMNYKLKKYEDLDESTLVNDYGSIRPSSTGTSSRPSTVVVNQFQQQQQKPKPKQQQSSYGGWGQPEEPEPVPERDEEDGGWGSQKQEPEPEPEREEEPSYGGGGWGQAQEKKPKPSQSTSDMEWNWKPEPRQQASDWRQTNPFQQKPPPTSAFIDDDLLSPKKPLRYDPGMGDYDAGQFDISRSGDADERKYSRPSRAMEDFESLIRESMATTTPEKKTNTTTTAAARKRAAAAIAAARRSRSRSRSPDSRSSSRGRRLSDAVAAAASRSPSPPAPARSRGRRPSVAAAAAAASSRSRSQSPAAAAAKGSGKKRAATPVKRPVISGRKKSTLKSSTNTNSPTRVSPRKRGRSSSRR